MRVRSVSGDAVEHGFRVEETGGINSSLAFLRGERNRRDREATTAPCPRRAIPGACDSRGVMGRSHEEPGEPRSPRKVGRGFRVIRPGLGGASETLETGAMARSLR